MAAYTMKSDNIFLRCYDMLAMDVYELDSPYTFPKKGKSWGNLGISIGPGNEYEALKIGDKEIKGADLQTLIKDLFNSRLTVNREGLCFVATAGVTAAMLEVEYYRVFDLFDWSKYQVTTSLNTKWARRNFLDGCPMDILGCNPNSGNGSRDDSEYKNKLREKEKELENEKLKHREELEKVAIKHREELEEVKRKKEEGRKTDDMIEVLGAAEKELEDRREKINKLKEELAMAERKKLEEIKEKQNEIDKLKEELDEAERRKRIELREKEDEIDELREALEEAERKNPPNLEMIEDEMEALKEALDAQLYKNVNLERELEICVFDRSGFGFSDWSTMDFYSRFAQYLQTDLPPSKITFSYEHTFFNEWPPTYDPISCVPLGRVESVSSLSDYCFQVSKNANRSNSFDCDNWQVLRCASSTQHSALNVLGSITAYYDGNSYFTEIKVKKLFTGTVVIPIPCSPQSLKTYYPFSVMNILGVGYRLVR